MRAFLNMVVALLREISGESAYQRHLKAHGVVHSPEEWRRFCDEYWDAAIKRPRCC